jgi:WhiB family redox-sensing transcriptional regulator
MFPTRPAWQLDAACRGMQTDLFFPERGQPVEMAKAVCAQCSVRVACLEFALSTGDRFGIWGGVSERPRQALRRARRKAS